MLTTREVACKLGLSPGALRAHMAAGNVRPPKRRVGTAYVWMLPEIEAAKRALAIPGRRCPRYVADALRRGEGGSNGD